ncbi:hypothetical protein CL622_06910 [archaeon]|nr:hypothetical protein [archaeon]
MKNRLLSRRNFLKTTTGGLASLALSVPQKSTGIGLSDDVYSINHDSVYSITHKATEISLTDFLKQQSGLGHNVKIRFLCKGSNPILSHDGETFAYRGIDKEPTPLAPNDFGSNLWVGSIKDRWKRRFKGSIPDNWGYALSYNGEYILLRKESYQRKTHTPYQHIFRYDLRNETPELIASDSGTFGSAAMSFDGHEIIYSIAADVQEKMGVYLWHHDTMLPEKIPLGSMYIEDFAVSLGGETVVFLDYDEKYENQVHSWSKGDHQAYQITSQPYFHSQLQMNNQGMAVCKQAKNYNFLHSKSDDLLVLLPIHSGEVIHLDTGLPTSFHPCLSDDATTLIFEGSRRWASRFRRSYIDKSLFIMDYAQKLYAEIIEEDLGFINSYMQPVSNRFQQRFSSDGTRIIHQGRNNNIYLIDLAPWKDDQLLFEERSPIEIYEG